jgi:hypothetical protein
MTTCLCSHPRQSHDYDGACQLCRCLQFEIGPSSGVPSVYRVPETRTKLPVDPALERAKASAELVEHVPAGSVPTGDAR